MRRYLAYVGRRPRQEHGGRHRWMVTTTAVAMLLSITAVPAGAGATGNAVDTDGIEGPDTVTFIGEASSATGAALGDGKCDVNGDGYGDVVVGAWFWDKLPAGSNEGTTYVLLGGPEPEDGDLADPATGAVQIDGAAAGDLSGFAVGCGGDVNGDGYDDILIGNYLGESAQVVFGSADFGPVDLGYLGEGGYRIQGSLALDQNIGYAVVGVGDVDGDGLADIGIAAVVADTMGRDNNGRIYIVPGQRSTATVDLTDDEASIMILEGSSSQERLGSLAVAGDVDDDHVDDLVVGSYTATPHGPDVPVAGSAWVVSGRSRGIIDLASIGDDGFQIVGPTRARDRLGISVAGLGDVNGDGLADLIVGGDGVTNAATGPRTGSAWVVFGSKSRQTVRSDQLEETGRGYWIHGAVQGDSAGFSVAGVGDVNGDGVPDALIGAYGHDPVDPDNPTTTMSNAGAAYVVYGKTDTTPRDLASLSAEEGYRIDGIAAGDRFGRQVAGVGDFDANHSDDFVISGDFAVRRGRTQGGEVRIVLAPESSPGTLVPGLPQVRSPEILVPTPGGEVAVTVQCPADVAGCTGSVAMRSAANQPAFDLAPGENGELTLSLNDKGRRLVTSGTGRLDDRVTVTAAGPKGRTLKREQRVMLLAEPKPPTTIGAAVADSHAMGRWEPAAFDTCPAELHDRFSVVGPDGKRYPTWHPPTITDPESGEPCSFGHEHGRDPRGSDIFEWVAHQMAHPRHKSATGIPFGLAAEALDEAVAHDPEITARHEDHVGHKIEYVNNVALLDTEGNPLGVTCDYLFKIHQGTHSPDALSNNVHELVYAMKCSDGAAVVSTTMVPFGDPGTFTSACAPDTVRSAGVTPSYPGGEGARLIPDRACIEDHVLVPGNRGSAFWAIYENWQADTGLTSGDGELASFNVDFAVFNPSRYAAEEGTTTIARILDVCWEVEANGDRANRRPCPPEADGEPFFCTFDDPRSPFDGARRELFIGQTTIRNAGGPVHWYTDPYGDRASSTPFPGSVRQYVAAADNSHRSPLAPRLFGRGSYFGGHGVHAPN